MDDAEASRNAKIDTTWRDERDRAWLATIKQRLTDKKPGLLPAGEKTEPAWVTRAQDRIDAAYAIDKEITYEAVDRILAEERAIDTTRGEAAEDSDGTRLVATYAPTEKQKAIRKTDDNYPTPSWVISRFLDTEDAGDLPGGPWLEPTAGSGAIIRAVNSYFTGIDFHAVELREEHEEGLAASGAKTYEIGDFKTVAVELLREQIAAGAEKRFNVAISNPPYNQAFEIIERCWPLARFVIMLLRVNYLASERRSTFHREHTPDVYVLPNRPSFAHDGKTDMTEYAWFVWDTSRATGTPGKVVILGSTPKGDRK